MATEPDEVGKSTRSRGLTVPGEVTQSYGLAKPWNVALYGGAGCVDRDEFFWATFVQGVTKKTAKKFLSIEKPRPTAVAVPRAPEAVQRLQVGKDASPVREARQEGVWYTPRQDQQGLHGAGVIRQHLPKASCKQKLERRAVRRHDPSEGCFHAVPDVISGGVKGHVRPYMGR